MEYGHVENLNWLWWVGLCVAVSTIALWKHVNSLALFATANRRAEVLPDSWGRKVSSVVLLAVALVAITVGLVDIRWGKVWREVPQRGIEVMFVLDVSRSMLAEDTSPNRLEKAKQYIKDMIQEMAGDRVGLVLFAGSVKQEIPLTNHYDDFAASLEEIGPHKIDRGGSSLGAAIEVAADSFLEKTSEHRAIVLFTDGEYHETQPIDAAQSAHDEHGTRIFTVGIGDSDAGAKIPQSGRSERGTAFLKHQGQTVLSKRNDSVLEQIALSTDGAYIPAGTKQVDMAQVYVRFIANIKQQEFESARVNSSIPRYHWFLGLALVVLLFEMLTPARPKRGWFSGLLGSTRAIMGPRSKVAIVVLIISMQMVNPRLGQSQLPPDDSFPLAEKESAIAASGTIAQLVQEAQRSMRLGQTSEAIEKFQAAELLGVEDPRVRFNKGVALYREGQLPEAREAWSFAAATDDSRLAEQARYNLGNSYYAEALQRTQQDPAAAIDSLERAISHFRSALRMNPGNRDARVNIELADRLRRQLAQSQEQEPEQQSQDTDQQQEGSEREEEHEKQSSPNEEASQREQQEPGNDAEQPSKSSPDAGEDSKNGSESSAEKEATKDSATQPEPEPQASAQDRQAEKEEDPQGESSNASPSEGELEALNQQPNQAAKGQDGEEGPPMTMQEARKLLQAVRDRELKNRIQELRRLRPRRVAVEKDW